MSWRFSVRSCEISFVIFALSYLFSSASSSWLSFIYSNSLWSEITLFRSSKNLSLSSVYIFCSFSSDLPSCRTCSSSNSLIRLICSVKVFQFVRFPHSHAIFYWLPLELMYQIIFLPDFILERVSFSLAYFEIIQTRILLDFILFRFFINVPDPNREFLAFCLVDALLVPFRVDLLWKLNQTLILLLSASVSFSPQLFAFRFLLRELLL